MKGLESLGHYEILRTDSHVVTAEKTQGKYWVELVELATGLTQILIVDTKKKALGILNGMSMSQIIRFYDVDMKIKKEKVYKAGKKFWLNK